MVDSASIIAIGLPVFVAVVIGLFFNGIDKDIIRDRDKLYPKITKFIGQEFKKYPKAEEPEKEKILNKIRTLDKFRINLRKTRDIRNYGFLFTLIAVVLIIASLLTLPYVNLNTFLSTSILIHCNPVSNATTPNTYSCYQLPTPISSVVLIFVAEFALFGTLFGIMLAYQKFILLWRMSRVIYKHIDEKNKDLVDIVCSIFKTTGYSPKIKGSKKS